MITFVVLNLAYACVYFLIVISLKYVYLFSLCEEYTCILKKKAFNRRLLICEQRLCVDAENSM